MALILGPMPPNIEMLVRELVAEAQRRPREIGDRPNGFVLTAGPVGGSYLDADGEVWYLDFADGSIHPIEDGAHKVSLIAIAAERVPEFSAWLPRRPANASDCQLCKKSGWLQPPLPRIQCPECHGMGWLPLTHDCRTSD